MNAPILEMKDIVKIYGGTKALNNANLKIQLGEVHALMGGNGAGKSTIIGIIAGSKKADGGKIIYKGEEIVFKTPRDAMQKGIAVVYQELSLIPHLSIAENIALIRDEVHSSSIFKWKSAYDNARRALELLGDAGKELKPEDTVENLRADQKQMVELARALSLDAKIILLDEPTSSLNFNETQQLFNVIRRLCQQGIGVIFVSHKMDELRDIADRITIFRDGVAVVEGALMSEKSDEEIIEDMLGRKMESMELMDPDEYLKVEKAPELLRIKYENVRTEIVL
ncbi:MAG: ATP-binding cassette domain-containing protein [Lachnospiraceae bacterium]